MDSQALKQQIKALNAQKGALSRQIGEKKKSGELFEDLLGEIQEVSQQLKQLDKQFKEANKSQQAASINHCKAPIVDFPAHIVKDQGFLLSKTSPHSVNEIDDLIRDQWNNYVEQHPCSHIYHRYEFRQVIETSFNHSCHYFAAFDLDKNIIGILPSVHTNSRLFGNYMTSIPFFNYGGPLANSPEISEALIKAACAASLKQGCKHFEIRESSSRQNYPARTDKVSMFRALPHSSEELWNDIGSKLRAQIKKGEQNNFQIKFGQLELLDDFYDVFSINMRDLGTPVYAKSFFRNLLGQRKLNSILVVQYHANKPISCAFLLGHKDVMEIPWASTLKCANPLNANIVMYWQILKHACEQKYSFFDFGRSSKNANTYKFKKQWGAKPAPLYWHYWLNGGGELPQLNPNNPKYQLVISLWKKLPVWTTKILGPLLVQNLP